MKWEPIETAPNDKVILIATKLGTIMAVKDGNWWKVALDQYGTKAYLSNGDLPFVYAPVTGWMPVPTKEVILTDEGE
jgi:hypothetical protein